MATENTFVMTPCWKTNANPPARPILRLKYIETCHSVITKSVSTPMSREKYAVKSSREHPKDTSLDTKKPPRAPKRETRDARDTPDPRPGDFALIFLRVKLKNDDSAAEWRRRHSSTTTPAHKNDWKKCYHNNEASPGRTVFYVDETIGFDKNRCHSAAESTCHGPGVPTIIIYIETITFNMEPRVKVTPICGC